MLNRAEYEMILSSLKAEGRALKRIIDDLEHRNLHDGNQNVKIQMRMHEINDLAIKIKDILKNLG